MHRRTPPTPAAIPPDAPPTPETEIERQNRQRIVVVLHGRILRQLRATNPTAHSDTAVVQACGYGPVYAGVAIALADLEDARTHRDTHPDDPAATAVTTAQAAMLAALNTHGMIEPGTFTNRLKVD